MTEKARLNKAANVAKAAKTKKPKFRRHESWRYNRLKESWRKPRGLDNKMRLNVKGWPKSAKIGYGGPRISRGLHPSGYEEVLVHTPDEVVGVDSRSQAIRIAHTVGTRKRIQIASGARERGIYVVNPLVRREIEEEEKTAEEEMLEEAISEPKEGKTSEQTSKRSKKSRRPKEVRST